MIFPGISDKLIKPCSSVAQSAERVAVKKGVILSIKRIFKIRPELQLPREIVVEKSGEIKEAFIPYLAENGNPEPSPVDFKVGGEGAETRASARTADFVRRKRPTPSVWFAKPGDEIVQAQKKFWDSCNH